ncbi:MarR family winged helix-turn-helix transcriptional regulator [Streptococcus saliviloxodontae]|uniref:DNA-binding MarR family transcriptional regulator n=1 Tax=Streptococcus saliviloxodontae TaxID=1349416 RepID=A0ABS2PJN8_9STRE|nr:MarR family transcriptional regulator [Streptococcus saliviloxodontae]MBM7635487.1 DNA-binding MarR family transcriptional regulator [Streptococcus saliviloxodontae]
MTETAISILIKRASLAFDKQANEQLVRIGLTNSQYKILKFLYRQPSLSVTQRMIEQHFDMSNPTVTGILQNLEKNDFIYRQTNPKDARSKVIGLSQKTLDMTDELLALGAAIDQELTKNLSSSDKENLKHLLQQLLGDSPC